MRAATLSSTKRGRRRRGGGVVVVVVRALAVLALMVVDRVESLAVESAVRFLDDNVVSSSRKKSGDVVDSTGLYVHIPFCRRRCRYCDFAIVPIGDDPAHHHGGRGDDSVLSPQQQRQQRRLFDSYTDAVVREIRSISTSSSSSSSSLAEEEKEEEDAKVTLDTLYFGGGTPSLAPLSMIQAIVRAIRERFTLASDLEFSMEMDPGTFDGAKLRGLKELGVNRISLGVQSFDDSVLEYLGRFHRRKDIEASIELLHDVYGPDNCNYSIDLIASLPGVTLADWCTTLATAVQKNPSHISVYDLTIEAGTVFGRWYDDTRDGDNARRPSSATRPLPRPEESAFQYQYASGYLRAAGYEHYEISSYARTPSGRRSRHNALYWGYDTTWYAAGLGATSFVNDRLMARPRALADYVDWVHKRETDGESIIDREEQQQQDDEEDTVESRLQDLVLKRLRTVEGLDLEYVRQQYGEAYVNAILRGACLDDLSELVVYEPPFLRLIVSKGFMFSNSIISSIFVALEEACEEME